MSSGKGKKKEQQLQGHTEAAITHAGTAGPLEERINSQTTRVLDWEEGKGEFANKSKDITELPGMDAALDIYGNAQALADQERFGQGATAFSDTANGAYGEQMKQQRDFNMHQARAEGLTTAANAVRGQARGAADTSIERDISRRMNVANLRQGNLNSYYGRPRTKPWYETAMEVGGKVASAFA